MGLLTRYLMRTILASTALVLLVLLALAILFEFIGQLDDVQGGFGIPQALLFAALRVPQLSFEMLPIAALIGSLLGLPGWTRPDWPVPSGSRLSPGGNGTRQSSRVTGSSSVSTETCRSLTSRTLMRSQLLGCDEDGAVLDLDGVHRDGVRGRQRERVAGTEVES